MQFFKNIIKATYMERPNRFIVICNIQGKKVQTYMPNPGRLWELFLPGATVYLEPNTKPEAKQAYTLVAVERDGYPIMLHTHKNNDVAEWLLRHQKVPGLEKASLVKREATMGNSRFDFLLRQENRTIYLEVKSCTLFGKQVAMFPDAVTARGTRHLKELAELSKGNISGRVLFIVHSPYVTTFMPEHHTDLDLAQTLIAVKDRITVQALSVGWTKQLQLLDQVKLLDIPWPIIQRDAYDQGVYLLVLKLDKKRAIDIGKHGLHTFKSGYYIYVGSAQKNLTARLERHKRLRKKMHWHIDYLRQMCRVVSALAIRTKEELECVLAKDMTQLFEQPIKGFGSSDCRCRSHLLYSYRNPLQSKAFHERLQYFRMDRLLLQSTGNDHK